MVKVVCGPLSQIECANVLVLAQLVLEFIGEAEFMIRAELENQTPKEMSVPLRSSKILNERARQGLCVDNGGFVVEVMTRRNQKRDRFADWPLQFGLGDGALVKRDRRCKGVASIEGRMQKVREHSSVELMNPALCFDFDPPFSRTPKFCGIGILIHGDVLDAGDGRSRLSVGTPSTMS